MHRAAAPAVAFLVLLAAAPGRASDVPRLELRALANEGVLLRAGETTIAIDAVIVRPLAEYGALPADAWAAMLAGAPPFEDLDLLLVSHPHEDHVDAEATAELLRARPGLRLISSPPSADKAAAVPLAGGGASEEVAARRRPEQARTRETVERAKSAAEATPGAGGLRTSGTGWMSLPP